MNIKQSLKQRFPFLKNIQTYFVSSKNTWPQEKLIRHLISGYEKIYGYKMDIYNPHLFTEKIQWYKIFYKGNGKLENIVDKYLFKQYIKEQLGEGYTIPLLGVWDNIESFKKDWESLPEEFCLKSTLQSDGKYIKMIHQKSNIDLKKLCKELREWLKPKNTLINSYCSAYYKATPRIIAEQYLENVRGQLYDYKIFCFSGSPFCIYVAKEHFCSDNYIDSYPITFYDLSWNKMDIQYGNHPTGDMQKPFHFTEMLEIAKKLSSGFPFVRIDFFDTKEKLLMAEMTFYPGGGNTPYHPKAFNEKMGKLFVLPQNR